MKKRVLALILGALFIGLAPMIHAFCVVPAAAALTSDSMTTMVHAMVDGSTMVMAIPATTPLSTGTQSAGLTTPSTSFAPSVSSSASSSTATIGLVTTAASTFGSILIAIGLAVFLFFGIRRCAKMRAESTSRAQTPPSRQQRWPAKLELRPYAVNLNFLGVSRI